MNNPELLYCLCCTKRQYQVSDRSITIPYLAINYQHTVETFIINKVPIVIISMLFGGFLMELFVLTDKGLFHL